MKCLLSLCPVLLIFFTSLCGQDLQITEVNYLGPPNTSCSNTPGDYCRGLEFTGPDGLNLSDYSLQLFDCNGDPKGAAINLVGSITGASGPGSDGSVWYEVPQMDDNGGAAELRFTPTNVQSDYVSYGQWCGNDMPTDTGIQPDADCSQQRLPNWAGAPVWLNLLPTPGLLNPIGNLVGCDGGTVLAVRWIEMTASRQKDGSVEVNWEIDNVERTAHFRIERSVDGRDFQNIHALPTAQTRAAQRYVFTDRHAVEDLLYYRVVEVEWDGTENYSQIVQVRAADKSFTVAVYPNPVSDYFSIRSDQSIQRVELLDQMGKVQRVFTDLDHISIGALPVGLYILRIYHATGTHTERLQVQ